MYFIRIIIVVIALFMIIPGAQARKLNPVPGKNILIHEVKRGEELHLLAGYYLMNTREWGNIFIWNSDILNNKNRIYPGQQLIVYVDDNWEPPFDLDDYVKSIGRR